MFDHATPIGEIVTASPTYYRIEAEFHGKSAHAGIRPEDLLLGVHGEPIWNVDDIHRLMVTRSLEVVPLALWRRNTREFVTVVPSRERKAA